MCEMESSNHESLCLANYLSKLDCQINLTANRNFSITGQGMQTTQIQLIMTRLLK